MHHYNLRSDISTYWKNSENIFHCIVHLHNIFLPYKNNFKKYKNKVAILITDFSDFGTKINFGTHHAPGLFLSNKNVVTHKFWLLCSPMVMYFSHAFTIYPWIAQVSYTHWLVELFYMTITRYHRSLNAKIDYSKMVEVIGLIFSVTLYYGLD